MNKTSMQWIVGGIALIIIAVGTFLFWKQNSLGGASPIATTTAATSSTPGYTIQEVPIPNGPTPPSYKGVLVCASDIPANACASMQAQNVKLIAQITKDNKDGNAWLNLATLRKINEDYTGAVAALVYVSKLYPSNPIAFSNLGDLYMNFLHEYPKAEANYLTAIKLLPADTAYYQTLFTLYTTTSYKPSTTSAENILKKGIAANPKAIDLEVVLARYYKSLGRAAEAKAEYDIAIANAKSQGRTDLAAQIAQEAGE